MMIEGALIKVSMLARNIQWIYHQRCKVHSPLPCLIVGSNGTFRQNSGSISQDGTEVADSHIELPVLFAEGLADGDVIGLV